MFSAGIVSFKTLFRDRSGGEGGGEQEVYLPPPPNFCHKIRTAIDFSQNVLNFNFYGQLKHDISSFVERR